MLRQQKIINNRLIDAAFAGDIPQVCSLLDKKAEINHINQYDQSALEEAAKRDHVEIIGLLLSEGQKIDPEIIKNAFFSAILQDQVRIIETFLAHDININQTKLHNDEKMTPLMLAAYCGQDKIARLLLDQKASIHDLNERGNTALIIAASRAHGQYVCKILIDHKADINQPNHMGDTPLIVAARNKCGIPTTGNITVNHANHLGNTALIEAVIADSNEGVLSLLKLKADMSPRNKAGLNALDLAENKQHRKVFRTLLIHGLQNSVINPKDIPEKLNEVLMSAVLDYDKEALKTLLSFGAAIHYQNKEGNTPLHLAVQYKQSGIVHVLLNHENMFDLDQENQLGQTALMLAKTSGQNDIAHSIEIKKLTLFKQQQKQLEFIFSSPLLCYSKDLLHIIHHYIHLINKELLNAAISGDTLKLDLLLACGADVNETNESGNTALHLATWRGFPSIIEKLLNNKAAINKINNKGNTALIEAIEFDTFNCANLLLEHGAALDLKNNDGHTALQLAKLKLKKTTIHLSPVTEIIKKINGIKYEHRKKDLEFFFFANVNKPQILPSVLVDVMTEYIKLPSMAKK